MTHIPGPPFGPGWPWTSRTSLVQIYGIPVAGFPGTMIGCACKHVLETERPKMGAFLGAALPEQDGPQPLITWPYARYYTGYGPRQVANDARVSAFRQPLLSGLPFSGYAR